MIELAYVDDFALSVFICMGTLAWHRHIDYDELFLVYSGRIALETEWGSVALSPGELAVVPKGVGHRSSSLLWSIVLLFQSRFASDRRNGDRRVFALRDEQKLTKVHVLTEADRQGTGSPQLAAKVDNFAILAMNCYGEGRWHRHANHDELIYVQRGTVDLSTEYGLFTLHAGEAIVLPGDTVHRLVAFQPAVLLSFLAEEATTL